MRLGAIEREVLENLSASDLLVGFLLSCRSTRLMYKIARERAMHRYRMRVAVERLVSEGYVSRRGDRLSINGAGRRLLDTAIVNVRAKLVSKKWDGKWRIVAFDIPERLQHLRRNVRRVLKRAGFIKLQHSVWVFPHECEEIVALIKQDNRLALHVLYGVLEKIGGDARLRRVFSLAAIRK